MVILDIKDYSTNDIQAPAPRGENQGQDDEGTETVERLEKRLWCSVSNSDNDDNVGK